jgi:hypothetical protein
LCATEDLRRSFAEKGRSKRNHKGLTALFLPRLKIKATGVYVEDMLGIYPNV